MKKKYLFALPAAAMVSAAVLLTGCGGSQNAAPVSSSPAPVSSAQAPVSEQSASTPVSENTAPVSQAAPVTSAAGAISPDTALDVALRDAGVQKSEISGLLIQEDYDDFGRPEYDITFSVNGKRYEYEVCGGDTISSREIESIAGGVMASDTQITAERAKQIALQDANLTESEVMGLYVEQDYDHGQTKFCVEFYHGNMEYSYEISADTGAIVEREADHHD